MSFLSFLLGQKKTSASVAKERLQIILAHERTGGVNTSPDYLDLARFNVEIFFYFLPRKF